MTSQGRESGQLYEPQDDQSGDDYTFPVNSHSRSESFSLACIQEKIFKVTVTSYPHTDQLVSLDFRFKEFSLPQSLVI